MAAPVDSPAYEWWVVAILVAATVATVEVGNMCSCDCLMVKGEGAQKQRTHTPRQENAHIDTLWEREGGGGQELLEVWATQGQNCQGVEQGVSP